MPMAQRSPSWNFCAPLKPKFNKFRHKPEYINVEDSVGRPKVAAASHSETTEIHVGYNFVTSTSF